MIELHELVDELTKVAMNHPNESRLKKLITYYEDKIDEMEIAEYETEFCNEVFV